MEKEEKNKSTNKFKEFVKNPFFIVFIALIAAGGILVYTRMSLSGQGSSLIGSKNIQTAAADTGTVAKEDLAEEVSVSGTVKPSENVDLAFENGGRVTAVYAAVGSHVSAGQTLAAVDSSQYSASMEQAEAGVAAQQAKLAELKRGARPEEIQVQQTAVTNAQNSLAEAQANIATTDDKSAASLQDAYNNELTAAQQGVEAGKQAVFVLTDLQYAHFLQNDQDGYAIANAKQQAVSDLLGVADAGRMLKQYLNSGTGGAYGQVQSAVAAPSVSNTEAAATASLQALSEVKAALDIIPFDNTLSAAERTTLQSTKDAMVSAINNLKARQKAIDVQKAANASAASAAKTAVVTAQNALASAKKQLTLVQAGADANDVRAQEAAVRQAQANVDSIASEFSKTVIHAPFSGTVTQVNAKVGQMSLPTVPAVSMISDGKFEVETYLSEADIAKVKVGDQAAVTTDAYGAGTVFQAVVASLDPAETEVNGVPSYKVTLQFSNEDSRIKSGLTANIAIQARKRQAVLTVPERAIITRGTDKFVIVDNNGLTEERKVETGITGTNGDVEIVSGLSEGEHFRSFGNGTGK